MNRASIPVELYVGLLAVWAVAVAYALSVLDQTGTAVVGVALVGFVIAAGLAQPIRGSGALAGLGSVLLYGGIQVAREISQGGSITLNRFFLIFAFALVAAITVFLTALLANRVRSIYTTLQRNATLIEELTVRDTVTGAIKRRYADQILLEEIQRARRFARVLSLCMLAIEGTDRILEERGREGLDEILAQVGQYLVTTLRAIDKVARHDVAQFALILPETKLEGAQIISERLVNGLAFTPGVTARVGIAQFPTDAATAEDLVREAKQALEFAQVVQLKVASRNLLEGEPVGA